MEAVVDGSSGNGIFAAAIDTNDRMVEAASTAAAQLRTKTAIATVTIGRRHHCRGCHCVIIPPSHPASVDKDCRQQRPPLPRPPLTAASINNDHHCCCWQQTMTAGFWRSSSLTVWKRQWRLSSVAIAVIDGGGAVGLSRRRQWQHR